MNETVEQIKKSWRSILAVGSIVSAVFLAGVATAGYLGIPERVSRLEVDSQARDLLIAANSQSIERHLEQFNRFLCLREAEAGIRRALECN